jgi:hypothetical protein
VTGTIRLDTRLERLGERAAGGLRLAPWEAAILLD